MSDGDLISQIEAAQAPAGKKRGKASPGWYPNPARVGLESWWDGATWTGHSRPMPPGSPDEPDRTAPAKGWWDDPNHPGKKAYWDGQRWIGGGGTEGADGTLVVFGWLGALFFAPVGFIIGVILMTRGSTATGLGMLLLSCLGFFLGYSLLIGQLV